MQSTSTYQHGCPSCTSISSPNRLRRTQYMNRYMNFLRLECLVIYAANESLSISSYQIVECFTSRKGHSDERDISTISVSEYLSTVNLLSVQDNIHVHQYSSTCHSELLCALRRSYVSRSTHLPYPRLPFLSFNMPVHLDKLSVCACNIPSTVTNNMTSRQSSNQVPQHLPLAQCER